MRLKSVNKGMTEKQIEQYLCKMVKKLNGIPYKFVSPSRRAASDRLCVFPFGIIAFIECKAPGRKPTPAQREELAKLQRLGHVATYVSTKNQVHLVIEQVAKLINQFKKN